MFVMRVFRFLLFLTIIYAENVNGISIQINPNVSATVTLSTPSTVTKPTSTSSTIIQHGSIKPITSTHNHNQTVVASSTFTKQPPSSTTQPSIVTTFVSEVSDMTNHHVYTGGSDVDEVGKGSHDHPPKEESVTTHSATSSSTTVTPTKTVVAPTTTVATIPPTSTVATTTPTRTVATTVSANSSKPMENKNGHSKTTAAGIVALICVSIASTAFVSLFAWRYVYRKRHGNREILINEEDVDFNDEDLRHFEATCIQLEPDA